MVVAIVTVLSVVRICGWTDGGGRGANGRCRTESQKEIRINVYSREATAFMNLLPPVILPFFYRHPRISTVYEGPCWSAPTMVGGSYTM